MKFNLSIHHLYLTYLFIPILIASCRKNDHLNTKDLLAYVPAGNSAYNILAVDSIKVLRSTILAAKDAGFPVLLSRAFERNVEVTARIDASLVAQYDSIYKPAVPSPVLSPGTFRIVNNGKVTIKTGQTQSGDSVLVQLADPTKLKAGTNNYVVPVVLTTASDGILVSGTRQIMFVKIPVSSVATSITSLAGKNVVSILLQSVNGVTSGASMVYLQGRLNLAINRALTANVQANGALVSSYNEVNGTRYQVFPSGSYQLAKASFNIPAGQAISSDSIQLELTDLSKFTPGANYLLPLELAADNQPDTPPADSAGRVVYVTLGVFVNNIDPTNARPTGITANRSSWQVSAGASLGGYDVTRILDDNNATSWHSDINLPAWVVLNMGHVSTIKGFSIVPSYQYLPGDFINMEIFSSNDGKEWKLEGRYSGTRTSNRSSASSPDVKYVRFLSPVTASYFKFNIIKTSAGGYAGMAELHAIE
ncbi:DUF1735 domain-containing protein [Chitinophaga pendula]|uniref:BT_3987 domain-containing protein n=1 Tax=Chitinophaga TaxID=79328 RepID=UPI000BAEFD85|nr:MULTISPECIES: DUF1735 domain-containing protein [Chitinophaga]ASZ12245.1 hypothetical protein CK934_15385 [Chitinophaga sp. MD30]UCJ10171.1 DUF1735 domain-containing protein [Chitinophaga pendula]